MKVRSKLADLDFRFGPIEYKKDHLILHSHPDQPMQTKVYVSPDDILEAIVRMLRNPRVWLYLAAFPLHLVRYRRRHAGKARKASRAPR